MRERPVAGFSPTIADASEKADNGRGRASCKKRRMYSAEFKREAAALAGQPGVTKARIGREVDINPNMITRWQREMTANGSKALLGRGVARDEARADIFNYIECFYNPRRRRKLEALKRKKSNLTQPSVVTG